MKGNCLRTMFLALVFSGLSKTDIHAQTTVQIGTGTDVPTQTLYSPMYRSTATSGNNYARSNIVFTQAELGAAGITAGTVISSIGFHKLNASSFVNPAAFNIYMANTANTTLLTTDTWTSILTTHTQVYTNASFNLPATASWINWTITPFTYTGGSLEIATDLTVNTGGSTGGIQWEYTAALSPDLIVGQTATSAPATLNGMGTSYKHRPNIRITAGAVTPVMLLEFAAENRNNDVVLKWATTDEINFSHFELERSVNAGPFLNAGSINKKAGSSNSYLFIDSNIVSSPSFYLYRLKMVDNDGQYKYSKTVRLNSSAGLAEIISVYPNPFTDKVSVKLNLERQNTVQLSVVDMAGKIIIPAYILNLAKGSHVVPLQLPPQKNGSGTYMVKAAVNGKITSLKIVR